MASALPISPAQPSVAVATETAASVAPAPQVAVLPAYKRGDFIGDKLQVVDVLGEGGFGIVYHVLSLDRRDTYALKTLRSELLRDGGTREMFRKEVQIWVDLGAHPHLVQAFWVDEIHGRLWLAMEYVAPAPITGLNSLDGYLAKRPPALSQALTWAIQFCHGMEYARSRGVRCHRDIKPANILIGKDGRVRISDFGIAGVTTSSLPAAGPKLSAPGSTLAGAVFGTPTHMAPEQFLGAARCDERSDVYSFGVVLFQMTAAGRLPFLPPPPPAGADPGAYYFEALRGMHQRSAPPALDSPAAAIVERCLQKDPARRFQTFRELRADLEALLAREAGGRSVAAPETKAPAAWDLTNKGNSLATLGRDAEALACYDQAIRLDAGIAAIHNNRGNALRRLGRHDEALAAFDRALALDARYAVAHVNRGLVHAERGAIADALAAFDRGLALDPRNVDAWISKGTLLGRLGRIQDELMCLERALQVDPRAELAWLNKAITLSGLGRRAEALAAYETCLQVNPRNTNAWMGKAVDLSESGRAAEAIACFDEALRVEPNMPQLWYNKGNALAQLGRLAEAHACFAETTRRAPQFPTGWYNKGLAEFKLERRPEAAVSLGEYMHRADRNDPLRADAEKMLGWIRSGEQVEVRTHTGTRVDDRGRARPAAAPAPPSVHAPDEETVRQVTLEPNDAIGTLRTLASGLIHSGQHLEAMGVVQMWMSAEPASADPHAAMGELLTGMGRLPEALEAFEKASALSPKDAGHLCNKGHVLEGLGRREEAVAALDAALALDPSLARAWANRGNSLNALKRFEESIAASDKAIALGLDEAGVHYNKGLSYRGLERWDDALAAFESAVTRNPKMAGAWYFKGELLKNRSRWDAALLAFDKVLELETADGRPRAMALAFRDECRRALAAASPSAAADTGMPLSRAEEWNASALRSFQQGRAAEALADCEQALLIDPHNETALENRAMCLFHAGRHEEALAGHERAVEQAPLRTIAWFNRGVMEHQLGRKAEALRIMQDVVALSGLAEGFRAQAQQAVHDLEGAGVQPSPRTAHLWLSVAIDAGSRQRWDELHAALDQALALDPRRPAFWRWKGEAHRDNRQFEDALQCFAQAVELDPGDADAHHGRGMALAQLQRYEDAVAAYDLALAAQPRHAASWSDRGKTLGLLKRYDDALASLDRAARLAPESPAPWHNKALIADECGRHAEALESYRLYLERAQPDQRLQIEHAKARVVMLEAAVTPTAAPAPVIQASVPDVQPTASAADCMKRAEINLNQGQLDKAVQWFDQAIAAAPAQPQGWEGKADALHRMTCHAEAAGHYLRVLALGPTATRWQKLATCLGALRRYDEALGAWDKALELAPSAALWTGRAQCLEALERHEDALQCCERALALDGRFAFARFGKARLEHKLGRRDAARLSYQQFLAVAPPHLGTHIQEARARLAELKVP